MDQIGEWRSIEPASDKAPQSASGKSDQDATKGRRGVLLVGALAVCVLGAAGLALWATTPQPQLILGAANDRSPFGDPGPASTLAADATAPEDLIVDVQGAVAEPGLHRLDPGSRVGDAIAAAGGYSSQVDIRAAADRLNLAERLTDGAKIHVPARGDTPVDEGPTGGGAIGGGPTGGPTGASEGTPPSTAGGPIELNTASQAQLETLPGIGPVTATKIIAARDEAPFASVDELLGRGVVGPATFEKIRDLVTVGP